MFPIYFRLTGGERFVSEKKFLFREYFGFHWLFEDWICCSSNWMYSSKWELFLQIIFSKTNQIGSIVPFSSFYLTVEKTMILDQSITFINQKILPLVSDGPVAVKDILVSSTVASELWMCKTVTKLVDLIPLHVLYVLFLSFIFLKTKVRW